MQTLQGVIAGSRPASVLHARAFRGRLQTVCRASRQQAPEQQLSRRAALSLLTAASGLINCGQRWSPALADAEIAATDMIQPSAPRTSSLKPYEDPVDHFSVSVPSDWLASEGVLPGNSSFSGASGKRRTLAWYPPDKARDTNVTITVTTTTQEFTRMGSFGNAYAFGTNLVNSMDRGYTLRGGWGRSTEPVQVAKLVDAVEARDMYYVEYTVQLVKPEGADPQRHLLSAVAMGNNGTYNRLYTVTAQCLESEQQQYKSQLEAVLKSFSPPPAQQWRAA